MRCRVKALEDASFQGNLDRAINTLAAVDFIEYKHVLAVHKILFGDVYPWAGQKTMKIIGSPHPPAPSPKLGRRGAGAKSGVSCSLSQVWERAGVRASNELVPSETFYGCCDRASTINGGIEIVKRTGIQRRISIEQVISLNSARSQSPTNAA
jgi:hypothetical protein